MPGDCRVDFGRIRGLYGAGDVSFAPLAVAQGLAGSSSGTFMPFTFHADLELLVDSALTGAGEIHFNAARAELSIAMAVPTYLALTSPRIADIAAAYAEVHP